MNLFKIKKIIKNIFIKFGLSKNHAKICAEAIINAELVGAHSHGLSRLRMYCQRIKKKVINSKPKIEIKKISPSISYIDADNSIGFVAADIGINEVIKNIVEIFSDLKGKVLIINLENLLFRKVKIKISKICNNHG